MKKRKTKEIPNWDKAETIKTTCWTVIIVNLILYFFNRELYLHATSRVFNKIGLIERVYTPNLIQDERLEMLLLGAEKLMEKSYGNPYRTSTFRVPGISFQDAVNPYGKINQ